MTDNVTKSRSLFQLGVDLQQLAEAVQVDPDTGEVYGMEELEAAQGAFEDKAAAVAVAIRGAEAYAEGLKKYKQDIAARQSAAEKKIESLKNYLATEMDKAGMKRLDRIEARITLRESEAVVVDDEELVPQEYKKITWTVSKTALKKSMDDGKSIPGAHVERRKGVVIK